MAGVDSSSSTDRDATLVDSSDFVPSQRKRRDSSISRRSAHPSIAGALPPHVVASEDGAAFADVQKALKVLKQTLATPNGEWSSYVDHEDNKIWMKKRDGEDLPVVRGECVVEGVTTEMVLGTLRSDAARKACGSFNCVYGYWHC